MKIPAFRGSRQKKPKLRFSKGSARRSQKSIISIKPLSRWHPNLRQLVNWIVIFGSALLCLLMLPTRFIGMELLGIGPNWLLIWVVAWSVKRTIIQGALAGIVLGLLQDAMTSPDPTHVLSLGMVGFLTALLQKQRFIQEDFISIALIVFGMAVLAETIFACQLVLMGDRNSVHIWTYYQKVALASAIVSSLWAPVVYFPLNRWWQRLKLAQQQS
ncbi:rod shape-determining protein MreD [Chlorogloeopsis sp. ULAP01]|uniref:rod shape-determining protein MreD n=1 Tax=Chlorogloeopsis sp. ULAP01 TaxID=3056483 RepID=UPI0025AB3A2C|nr:rod shape-determining protein MreD [Chlorogloeopsis sp. ULAP01]MDM9380726.1 rod shape-determining protein MreD [Chlorogloeopsis sp. ULAP01]